MEQQIQRALKRLKDQYILFWALPVLTGIAGETDLLPVGALVDNVQGTYLMETLGILTVALCVPLSLKLFSWVLTKKIDQLTFPVALKQYVQWSTVRLILLEVAVILNLLCYYFTMHSTGALCALIALTASFFCIPSEQRFRNELHITTDKE